MESPSSKPLHIPDDITSKILISLPPKSLLRFTIVAKSWQNLIQSHKFIHSHIKHNNNKRTEHIFSIRYDCSDSHDDDIKCRVDKLKNTVLTSTPLHLDSLHVIGHCNGIICLITSPRLDKTVLVFWNPALHQCRRVSVVFSFGEGLAGFWYDSKNQDYKVLLGCKSNGWIARYSLKMNMWRRLSHGRTTFTKSDSFGIIHACLCFEGKLHWTTRNIVDEYVVSLVVFNLADEKFGQFAIPMSSPDVVIGCSPGIFRGRLSVIMINLYPTRDEFEIWSTTDLTTPKSWIKVLAISTMRLSVRTPFLRPLGLHGAEKPIVLIGLTSDGKVLLRLHHIPNFGSAQFRDEVLSSAWNPTVNSRAGLLLNGHITKPSPVKHGFDFIECVLVYDAETHRLKVHKDDSDDYIRWYAITDYLESLVSMTGSNSWLGNIACYLISWHVQFSSIELTVSVLWLIIVVGTILHII